MYQIRRVNISDVFTFCRSFGSQRNQSNHYDTLRVQNNSTQQEIRDAFLKLSKELHPDIGNKGNHAEFIKINEAYKILSKDLTRRQYDTDLKYQSVTAYNGQAHRHSDQTFYHNPTDFKVETNKSEAEFTRNYYGIKGVKRVSNGKVAMICAVVCLIIVSLEIVALRSSVLKNQRYLNNRSLQIERDYDETRAAAHDMTREEQIEAMHKRLEDRVRQQNLGENNR